MVCTANRASALKLLVEAYPFHSNKSLLTVYDYESEAVSAMADTAHKRGAKVMSASFSWPNLRIHSAKLKRILQHKNNNNNNKKKKKKRGLFVFPLQSRMTGAMYPYLWMRIAQENGWHVLLDACALGPKDLDTLGLSLIQPDFIICSFFKVVGENPSGFASLLVKNYSSGTPLLEGSVMARSIGIVSIVPAQTESQLNEAADDLSGTFSAVSDINHTVSSFSGPMSGTLICNGFASKNINNAVLVGAGHDQPRSSKPLQVESRAERFEQGETSSSSLTGAARDDQEKMASISSGIVELDRSSNVSVSVHVLESSSKASNAEIIECMGLDHADSLGLLLISSRLRYITNWLVIALLKLRHPNSENGGHSLVRIYGPRIKFERGPAIAFNVFDWKGEKVEPALVQKLADRSNISLTCGFLHNIWFSDKYQEGRDEVVETRSCHQTTTTKRKDQEINDVGIGVVNASLGFLADFEDAYKLWSFVARFLDADFIEKERWRYMALNHKMIEV